MEVNGLQINHHSILKQLRSIEIKKEALQKTFLKASRRFKTASTSRASNFFNKSLFFQPKATIFVAERDSSVFYTMICFKKNPEHFN